VCALRARCQDSRVYSSFLNDNRVPFVGYGGMWVVGYVGCGPPTLCFYDFSLQILFQEIEIGHL